MATVNKPERRRYTRVEFNADVILKQKAREFQSHIVDLSLNGILLETPENYEIRADIPAEVCIALADDTLIHMWVSLVRSSSDVLGFRCDTIDVESIMHLRRLIELNIDDPHASERVLSELVSSAGTGRGSTVKHDKTL